MASPGPELRNLRVGALRMVDPGLKNLRMSAVTELSLLSCVAALAGGFALAAGDLFFTVIFSVMSGLAFGHVLRQRD